jgi:YVTN family beta-propeller protein
MRHFRLGILLAAATLTPAAANATHIVDFKLTDEPGRWFKNTAGPIAGTHSLAVVNPFTFVRFSGHSHTVHTMTSLLWPTGAPGMPFDTKATKGTRYTLLVKPGLYVFVCKIHPYMLGAVIVDNPFTQGLDLGETVSLVHGPVIPTSSDLATRLLRAFFVITNPSNWQDFGSPGPWHITYPDVDVRITGGAVVNLPAVLNARYGNDTPLPPLSMPSIPGVGEVWVNAQYELTAGKEKPGTSTAVDAATWKVKRKVALPQINMNNPHNMWTDRNQELIYTAQWFDTFLTVFDRTTGHLLRNLDVGEAPAHVMTRVDTDQVHVTVNGSASRESVVELSPRAQHIERYLDIKRPHPHAHWMSHDGHTMVTPNMFTADSSIYDFPTDEAMVAPAGALPIASGMMPDASKFYVANYLDGTISVIDTQTAQPIKTIDLLANYDPITGAITGPVGGLPIQTPVSPNGKYMVTANTLTATIVITSTVTDTMVKMLPCDAGCHGVNFGAKQGGGYYAYVSSKFANTLLIVDPDPNGDGNPIDAALVGRVLLNATSQTARDDGIVGLRGQGGQGVLPIPVVYNGWVQKLPAHWKAKLTPQQLNPFP